MKQIWPLGILAIIGCAPGLPGPGGGARAVAPRSGEIWAPERVDRDLPPSTPPEMPSADVLARRNALTLTDVIDIALHNNPTTRISWSNARAAAARLGAARGDYLPTAQVDLRANKLQTAGTQGTSSVQQTTYGPSASFTWLLLDLNRGPSISAARNALLAADWTHNAAVQDVVLQTGQAYYTYAAFRALLVAQQATKAEADTNLAAAEERRRVGLATIAEVLQARTAAAQALLDLQRTEGDVAATRGALAVATGLPANADFDVDSLAGTGPIGAIVDSVDALIALARANRPDLAAAAATWRQSQADARAAYGKRLPSLTAQGNAGRTYLSGTSAPRESYSVGVGLSIPLFNGFTWEYEAEAARELARAQAARADQLGQRAVLEVFTDYYALRTATQSVRTTEELYASAEESAQAALGRYRAGVGSLLELLTAESARGNARALKIQARLSWNTALLQLAHDVGVLDARGGHSLRIVPDTTNLAPPR
ncbi:MAG TPA: TolC family protein [Gemmatimonadales bacterium]|nr:TolC family protein [Gemmatimonadales bacterium]